jgi:hypothetical protein
MNPRLKSSKKWTALPKEYVSQIYEVFHEAFAQQLKKAQLIIEGRIYSEEILLCVGILEEGRLAQANFEVSTGYGPGNKNAVERIHDAIDAAASMMAEYFENDGEVDFPRTWKAYDFNEHQLYLQFSTENSALESAADQLLGIDEEGLVQEEIETDDAIERADETITADDEELSGEPTMFGGKKKKKKEDLH